MNREEESSQEGEPGAELEDLTKTCNFTSLFILVVLRWIESGSRLANIRGFNDRARSSHDSTTISRRTAEGLRNQTQVHDFCFTLRLMIRQWQTTQTWKDLRSCVLNGRLLKQTFMSLSRILWKIWDYVFADVIHFCLTYLDFCYLMIGSVSPRFFWW